ncbi:hypothetical protein PSTG_05247 [Puccinia striiformis f. sp. tritici PST-78]|uniref:Uncharacterized protein n=1 Tax=Puccinia striiformis f. sp. tritici PST-78 TaxID=1165861 RepID=A0A0L0VQC5_9BASI|nr:hypothetical protein PSTG_05247 [Puccinia striiformis f. sp. tritici PST-78]
MTHVPGKTVTLPDGLSRRPPDPSEEPKDFDEEEQWIKPHPGFGIKEVYSANLGEESKQVGIWKYLQIYLETLNKPPGCSELDYKKMKQKSAMFFMSEDQLKRRSLLPFH